MPRDDKVAILKESLAAIGRRIEVVLDTKQAAGEDRDRWRRHLWTCVNEPGLVSARCFLTLYFCLRFVTLFWPKKVRAGKLEEIHAKMVIKEGGDATAPKKPRLSSNGKPPTGNGATPSSSARTNGKSYR
jgi:chromodomain-helicase-DNA-binding protein 1